MKRIRPGRKAQGKRTIQFNFLAPTKPPYRGIVGRNSDKYADPEYLASRRAYLILNPFCEYCAAAGVSSVATEVDHLIEIEAGGSLTSHHNFVSTCGRCHAKKSGKAAHKKP